MPTPPSGTQPDPGRRRAALQSGLETVLTAMQVKAALLLWDQQYAATRSMALAEYVADLAQRLDYSIQERHALRVAIYHAISTLDLQRKANSASSDASAKPAGIKPPPPPAVPPPPVAPTLPAPFVVFQCMANHLLASVKREGTAASRDFSSSLDQHAQGLRMTGDQLLAIRRWLRGEGTLEVLAKEPSARHHLLIHALYAAAAEAIGPSAADRVLARANQLAAELPEAEIFPPRMLL